MLTTTRPLGGDTERFGNVGECRLLLCTHLLATEAYEPSLASRFGDLAADGAQPRFEGCRLLRCLGIKNGRDLPQSINGALAHIRLAGARQALLQRFTHPRPSI